MLKDSVWTAAPLCVVCKGKLSHWKVVARVQGGEVWGRGALRAGK